MTLYREFRGAEPSRTPLLKARGLWVEPETTPEEIEMAEAAMAEIQTTDQPLN
jgi:hypothetical protein